MEIVIPWEVLDHSRDQTGFCPKGLKTHKIELTQGRAHLLNDP